MNATQISVRGTGVRLLESGTGEPLIYLHGASGGGEWLPFLEQLSAEYHVYAPEHPGFGESGDLPYVESIEDLAFHYLDFLDALGIAKAHFVGSSLGGWLALEIATLAPHRMDKLVLMGAAGLRVEGVEVPDTFMMDSAEHLTAMFYDPDFAARRLRAISTHPDDVAIQYRNRATVAHLAWNPYFHRPQLRHRLHRVTMPVLLVWGEQDKIFPPAIGEAYVELLSDAQLCVISECGHLPAQEQADKCVSLIRDFIQQGVR
ncbi:alpha/beta fold hydrolase [Alicyclobacillus sp. ALC3]|uniref:alpha/beta fold hydrolase n=1 Tax=Alicyclobacillus sp. ALC3 TaxID=2796143 RepID=UPI002378BC25|nr:alpha/beta fold hydrolase [Alicyclobacillus sp. ALC3]WDL97633.1 alpha/beta fold hydrolase [Alicyclobacillus sp. ALC3]